MVHVEIERECLFCKVKFVPKTSNQLYCSKKHRRRLYVPETFICQFCNKEATKNKVNQLFCSDNCSRLNNLRRYVRIPSHVLKGTRQEVVDKLLVWLEEREDDEDED